MRRVAAFYLVLAACQAKPAPPAPEPAETVVPATSSAAPEREPADIPIDIPVADLLKEYAANEVRADARFKGKVLRGSGVLGAMGKSKSPRGGIYLSIGTGEALDRSAVHCSLEDVDDPLTLHLNVSEKVTIEGRGEGLLSYGAVSLSECKVNPVARLCLQMRKILGERSLCHVDADTGDVGEVSFDPTGGDAGPFSGSYAILDCYGASAKRELGAKQNWARATAELRKRFPDATLITSKRIQCLGIFFTKERGKLKPFVSGRKAAIESFFEAL